MGQDQGRILGERKYSLTRPKTGETTQKEKRKRKKSEYAYRTKSRYSNIKQETPYPKNRRDIQKLNWTRTCHTRTKKKSPGFLKPCQICLWSPVQIVCESHMPVTDSMWDVGANHWQRICPRPTTMNFV